MTNNPDGSRPGQFLDSDQGYFNVAPNRPGKLSIDSSFNVAPNRPQFKVNPGIITPLAPPLNAPHVGAL